MHVASNGSEWPYPTFPPCVVDKLPICIRFSLFRYNLDLVKKKIRILSLCLRIRLCFTIPLMPQPFFRFRFYNILCSAYLKWDFVVSSFICIYMSFSVPLFSIKNNAQYCFYLNGLISSLRTHDKMTNIYIHIIFIRLLFIRTSENVCVLLNLL